MKITVDELARCVDYTLLRPEATPQDIRRLCMSADTYQFAAVCVNPIYVEIAADELKGSSVKVCTVIGFPLGATFPEVKAFEAQEAVRHGAEELDMVMNIGALRNQQYGVVREDIEAVVDAVDGYLVKVILETGLLTSTEKRHACKLAKESGAHFVKTSTGFGPGGATVEDIQLMREVVGESMGVKASGGIRTFETALQLIEAGATRLGASAAVDIIESYKSHLERL
ncbi:MAG: deoxyribose-phosphate aldolase [Promethearchaeota archaeon]